MSRSPEHYDISRKKFAKKKKKKRFERPRIRYSQVEDRLTCIARQDVSIRRENRADEVSAYTDAASGCTPEEDSKISEEEPEEISKIWEEASSTFEEYFDASEGGEVDELTDQDIPDRVDPSAAVARIRLKLDGTKMIVLVDDGRGRRSLEIPESEIMSGVDWTVMRLSDDSLALGFHSRPESRGHGDVKTDDGMLVSPTTAADTTMILGADDISKTDDTYAMTCNRLAQKEPEEVEEKSRELSPPSEPFMVSETSDEVLNSYDSSPVFKNTSIRNVSVILEENPQMPKMKTTTESTVSSIPLDTITLESRRGASASPDASALEDLEIESVQSYAQPYFPPVKSKSDSLIISDKKKPRRIFNDVSETKIRNDSIHPDLYAILHNRFEGPGDDWQYSEGHQLSAYCYSQVSDNDKFSYQFDGRKSERNCNPLLEEDFHYNEEAPERPMTSAADAVKTMRQALKPINDQINDIRTKMIGMNIQPRSPRLTTDHPPIPERGSNPTKFAKINRWLQTDPQQFSSHALEAASSSVRQTNNLYVDDSAFSGVTPQAFHPNKLVIFPARSNFHPDLSHSAVSHLDNLSYLSRTSIVTDPEDLRSEENLVTWRRRDRM